MRCHRSNCRSEFSKTGRGASSAPSSRSIRALHASRVSSQDWVTRAAVIPAISTAASVTTRPAFADASRRIDGFHLRHEERLRLFYEMNTAEVGFRWVTTWMDVSLSAGVAFGQRYFTGDDLRHRTPGGSIEDLPFIALTFPSTFWAAPFSSGVER